MRGESPSRFWFLHRVRAVCLMETDDLPRQARDTHKENSTKTAFFARRDAVSLLSPDASLPAEWASKASRSTGEIYYLNLLTMETTYDKPTAPAIPPWEASGDEGDDDDISLSGDDDISLSGDEAAEKKKKGGGSGRRSVSSSGRRSPQRMGSSVARSGGTSDDNAGSADGSAGSSRRSPPPPPVGGVVPISRYDSTAVAAAGLGGRLQRSSSGAKPTASLTFEFFAEKP